MHRIALLCVALAVGCSEPPSDAPGSTPAFEPSGEAQSAAADTTQVSAEARALVHHPEAPLRVDGACPFEGCQYGAWTTTAETTVYAAPGDTLSAAFSVPASTELAADRGFVLLTALGRAVAQRDTEVYGAFGDTRPVATGDTLLVLDYEGEGSYRVWAGGVLAFSDQVVWPGGAPPADAPFRVLAEPVSQWWAHVTLAGSAPAQTVARSGWLWMERTPPVEGADALGG